MRINKFLSEAGIASRRKVDNIIGEGRVKINGVVAEVGTVVNPDIDKITVDGKLVKRRKYVYLAFYKPSGCTTTLLDPHANVTLKNFLPEGLDVFPVGRLDKDSEGLLLLTNDGDFAFNITHPKFNIEKEYKVLLSRKPDEKEIGEMIEGVESDNDVLRVVSVSLTGKTARVIMTEGKKREVKRLFKAFGIRVLSLKRIRIGNLLLGNLRPGEIRNIYPENVGLVKC